MDVGTARGDAVVRPRRLLVVEGGGNDNQALKAECRRAFAELQRSAGIRRRARTIVAGGRAQAYDRFCNELSEASSGDVVVLLVDSEEVPTSNSRWKHVAQRKGDGWSQPPNATENDLHFMTVVMETWLLADPAALQAVFGRRFKAGAIPAWPDLEAIPKSTVYSTLEKATSHGYDKGQHSFKALARVDASRLQAACPAARALFDRLRWPPTRP